MVRCGGGRRGKLPLLGRSQWREDCPEQEPSRQAVVPPGEGWGDLTKAGRGDRFQRCGQDRAP